MYPHIREPASGPAWLNDYTRQVEAAIAGATDALSGDISAIEEQLLALSETLTQIADYISSIEQMTVGMATAARVQTDQLAQLVALTRGLPGPLLGEEGDALIQQFISKDAR